MADPSSRSGTRYADPAILDYTAGLHAPHDAALEAAFAAPDHEDMPAIMVGPSEGRFLELIMRLARVRTAVEIGTLAGYSALRIARALPPEGRLWTLEVSPEYAAVARRHLEAAGLADRVTVVEGGALESLGDLEPHGPFDAVFLDADKGNYDAYGRWAAAQLRPGGLLLADNAYYFGKLLDAADPAAAAMRRFHEQAAVDFDSVCIPTPDGLLLGLRKH